MKPGLPDLLNVLRLAPLGVALATLPGCGLIFGGDQRVDNKSHDYTVVRLDRDQGRSWRVLAPDAHRSDAKKEVETDSPDDTGDIAFERSGSGTIISVDSVCHEYRDASLDELMRYLLLGLKTDGPVRTKPSEVDGVDALDSTVEASMSRRSPSNQSSAGEETPVRVRAVVLRKSGCTYDLMLIARPDEFETENATFDRFLKGFHAH